jgi:hypothetical protein
LQDRWDERSAIIDTAFHRPEVYFTPLVGNSITMPDGVGWDQYYYVGAEIVKAHINHEPIGRYARMTTPIYVDTRQRRVRARDRWGSKIQYDVRDQMVTRYGNDTAGFISAVLRDQMAADIVGQQEKISRDGMLNFALHQYLYDGTQFVNGTADFSDIPQDASGVFDIKIQETVALRMAYRSEYTLKQWGDYANPVPGANFRNSVLVMMTTGSYWSIWNSEEQQFMIDLRQLQDSRIINGGRVMYRDFVTIQDTGAGPLVLWNAGTLTTQVAVISPVMWGDGSPDPASDSIDGVFLTGQSSGPTHYVQCSSFAAGAFAAGDMVTIHTGRREDYGITDGVDFLHGKSMVAEVYEVDATNNRLTFRNPLTEQYDEAFDYRTLAGSASSGTAYAFVTKAQHIHPVMVVGTREMVQFVRRRQPDGTMVQYHRPVDTNVDFPSVERVTANWYGEVNPWNLDVVEVFYCSAPFANRGAIEY